MVDSKFGFHHPVIVVGCLIEKDGKYLLVKETKEPVKGLWNIPSGKLELGENIVEGVIREVLEETGYKVAVENFLGIYQPKRDGAAYFLLFSGKYEKVTDDFCSDVSEQAWFTSEEIMKFTPEELRSARVKMAISDYEAKIFYPTEIIKEIK